MLRELKTSRFIHIAMRYTSHLIGRLFLIFLMNVQILVPTVYGLTCDSASQFSIEIQEKTRDILQNTQVSFHGSQVPYLDFQKYLTAHITQRKIWEQWIYLSRQYRTILTRALSEKEKSTDEKIKWLEQAGGIARGAKLELDRAGSAQDHDIHLPTRHLKTIEQSYQHFVRPLQQQLDLFRLCTSAPSTKISSPSRHVPNKESCHKLEKTLHQLEEDLKTFLRSSLPDEEKAALQDLKSFYESLSFQLVHHRFRSDQLAQAHQNSLVDFMKKDQFHHQDKKKHDKNIKHIQKKLAKEEAALQESLSSLNKWIKKDVKTSPDREKEWKELMQNPSSDCLIYLLETEAQPRSLANLCVPDGNTTKLNLLTNYNTFMDRSKLKAIKNYFKSFLLELADLLPRHKSDQLCPNGLFRDLDQNKELSYEKMTECFEQQHHEPIIRELDELIREETSALEFATEQPSFKQKTKLFRDEVQACLNLYPSLRKELQKLDSFRDWSDLFCSSCSEGNQSSIKEHPAWGPFHQIFSSLKIKQHPSSSGDDEDNLEQTSLLSPSRSPFIPSPSSHDEDFYDGSASSSSPPAQDDKHDPLQDPHHPDQSDDQTDHTPTDTQDSSVSDAIQSYLSDKEKREKKKERSERISAYAAGVAFAIPSFMNIWYQYQYYGQIHSLVAAQTYNNIVSRHQFMQYSATSSMFGSGGASASVGTSGGFFGPHFSF